jgi:membrane fusion protein (multidrug efflux system)
VAALVVVGCNRQAADAPPPPPAVVVVADVVQKDVPIYRDWVGTLAGDVNATISAQVTGYLISREYREGSVVTKGQVLFQIDPAPFQSTLDKAKAQLDEAIAHKGKTALDVERYTPLAATSAISQQELDDAVQADKAADGQVASAKAAVQESQLNLDFTTIRSPVDGVAGMATAQIGDLVGPSTGALTTVVQISPMRAYFFVAQQIVTVVMEKAIAEGRDLRTGEAGPELELILASGSTYSEKGKVLFADNQVDVKTGTVQLVGEFPNPQMLLVPGMFVRVRALLDVEKGALVVPQRAVTDIQGRYLVVVVDADNKVSIRPVEVGERYGPEWIISGNIKAGDRVIVEGVQKARDGDLVNPVKSTEPGEATTSSAAAEGPK